MFRKPGKILLLESFLTFSIERKTTHLGGEAAVVIKICPPLRANGDDRARKREVLSPEQAGNMGAMHRGQASVGSPSVPTTTVEAGREEASGTDAGKCCWGATGR